MKVDSAVWEGGCLKLHTADVDARHFAYAFTPGEYEIRPKRSLRSLEANALFWKLCQDVAQAVGLTKNEVYKNAIREVGTYSTLIIDYAAIPQFEKSWASKGIGWFCDVADDAQEEGKKDYPRISRQQHLHRKANVRVDRQHHAGRKGGWR